MRVVKVGDRGASVEDIQRRLLTLGYNLGPTKVDGVFFEETAEAVRVFQRDSKLYADGVVGPRTWSALVDSTFMFGDRMLYLRTPHFHGNDVKELQRALNSLGFACGDEDGILGTFTERAVVEFQQNAGLGADGIVGPNTFGALAGLRHIWSPRSSGSHSQAHGAPVDRAILLPHLDLRIGATGAIALEIARRIVNVAEASTPETSVRLGIVIDGAVDAGDPLDEHQGAARRVVSVLLVAIESTPAEPDASRPPAGESSRVVPYLPEKGALAQAIAHALQGEGDRSAAIVIAIGNESFSKGSKQGVQRAATTILDAVCLAAT